MGMTIQAIEWNRKSRTVQDQSFRDVAQKTQAQNNNVAAGINEQSNATSYPQELSDQELGFAPPEVQNDRITQEETEPLQSPDEFFAERLGVIGNEKFEYDKQPPPSSDASTYNDKDGLTPNGSQPGNSGPPKQFVDADKQTKASGLTRSDGTSVVTSTSSSGDLFEIFCQKPIEYASNMNVKYSDTSGGGNEGTSQAQSYGDDLNNTAEKAVSSGEMDNPVPEGSYNCGDWQAPRAGGTRSHEGLDIFAPIGTPVYAARDGKVVYSAKRSEDGGSAGFGLAVRLEHGDGLETIYSHLNELVGLSPGESVKRGQLVGYVGMTGNAANLDEELAHLHFEVRHNNVPQPPCNFIQ